LRFKRSECAYKTHLNNPEPEKVSRTEDPLRDRQQRKHRAQNQQKSQAPKTLFVSASNGNIEHRTSKNLNSQQRKHRAQNQQKSQAPKTLFVSASNGNIEHRTSKNLNSQQRKHRAQNQQKSQAPKNLFETSRKDRIEHNTKMPNTIYTIMSFQNTRISILSSVAFRRASMVRKLRSIPSWVVSIARVVSARSSVIHH
jgi:hypothetical protein